MMNCKDLYWDYIRGYNNIFNATWIELTMNVIAKNMILDGLY